MPSPEWLDFGSAMAKDTHTNYENTPENSSDFTLCNWTEKHSQTIKISLPSLTRLVLSKEMERTTLTPSTNTFLPSMLLIETRIAHRRSSQAIDRLFNDSLFYLYTLFYIILICFLLFYTLIVYFT